MTMAPPRPSRLLEHADPAAPRSALSLAPNPIPVSYTHLTLPTSDLV